LFARNGVVPGVLKAEPENEGCKLFGGDAKTPYETGRTIFALPVL
jgi:hypothetical protein